LKKLLVTLERHANALPLGLFVGVALLCLPACAEMRETPSKELEYRAYGKTWRYYTIERYTKSLGFNTSHGLIGDREKLEQSVYLLTEEGEKIPVHERIYALQKDGSYRKVECCANPSIQASVYDFDNKLILNFEQSRKNVTDCLIYPTGYPDNEKEPDPMKRKKYATLFGEFDPNEKVFRVREFLPDFSSAEFRQKLGTRPTTEQTVRFFYLNRRPFICN
jgi:hypothetical protein